MEESPFLSAGALGMPAEAVPIPGQLKCQGRVPGFVLRVMAQIQKGGSGAC